ncbi:DUF1592 domain-containing protein [Teredinibacter turnerae]|uniref:DUF1592 domain-containing protein n=1 Tax=Teredinibacter turnerae TaxID=2426 RepID=UPI00037E3FC0|nr:DUF1592 domain-containing protein [Teredinibacter turnerae]
MLRQCLFNLTVGKSVTCDFFRHLRIAMPLLFSAVVAHASDDNPMDFLDSYCERCHNDERFSGNLSLSDLDTNDIFHGRANSDWENILRMVKRGEMPPPGRRKMPGEDERAAFTSWLENGLDDYASANPNPGRATLRRLNRTEYSNAIRDLLAVNLDIREQLPADDTGYGFDNIADVLSVSPTLMDRYLAVAGKVSRLAVGVAPQMAQTTSYLLPKDGSILNQGIPSYDWRMSDKLPLNSRGGGEFTYYAPYDGEYIISGYLNANTNNEVDRLEDNRVAQRVSLTAGEHSIGISFRKQLALDESVQTLRNSTDIVPLPDAPPHKLTLDFIVDSARVGSTQVESYYMSPRYAQHNFLRDVIEIDVEGPYQVSGVGATASREKIFSCRPNFWPFSESRCAKKIIGGLARQAYRRPVSDADIAPLLRLYQQLADAQGFDTGIATAIQAILVSPRFLFLHERDNPGAKPGEVHPLDDYEYAARLALFLWSSLPDEALLKAAAKGTLREPEHLRQQITRMLQDEKSRALATNFAGQWLYLRNLEHHRADVYLYPEFDAPLREAMREESEYYFAGITRENRSILEFLDSDYSYLNERLAKHYGIDGVSGPQFRRVTLPVNTQRGGLLGQASVLTVTSYANHTSVVKRGKWVLDNILAAPPPPPPPDVPALKSREGGKTLSAREQLALHREDPACASCHVKMDPLGLALENYDPIGRFRTQDIGLDIDASAVMPDGTAFAGLTGLQQVLMARGEQFAEAFTQRLMTYALARGVESIDQPAVRNIVRAARGGQFKMQDIIFGIAQSEPFNYRKTPDHEQTALTHAAPVSARNGNCARSADDALTDVDCERQSQL